jgi:predicted 2-oxoglutarate/Fe(II)-dependent dioxygenase YbiX
MTIQESIAGERRLPSFLRIKSFLNREQCSQLVNDCVGRQRFHRSGGGALAKKVSISYLKPEANIEMTQALERLCVKHNTWNLRLGQIVHPMRIQQYVRGDFNDVHSDFDYDTQDYSKLTIVVPLVPRSQWSGGDLSIGNGLATPKLEIGDAIVFPSFLPHFVSRVQKGRRIVLSAWVSGPPLR